jgi:hypothetical protein
MFSRGSISFVLAFTLFLSACGGGTFFVSHGPGGTNVLFVSGTCSTVQQTAIVGPGGSLIVVTAVTLFSNGSATTTNFCGNIVSQFPLNTFVSVQFTNGSGSATPTSIVTR